MTPLNQEECFYVLFKLLFKKTNLSTLWSFKTFVCADGCFWEELSHQVKKPRERRFFLRRVVAGVRSYRQELRSQRDAAQDELREIVAWLGFVEEHRLESPCRPLHVGS